MNCRQHASAHLQSCEVCGEQDDSVATRESGVKMLSAIDPDELAYTSRGGPPGKGSLKQADTQALEMSGQEFATFSWRLRITQF